MEKRRIELIRMYIGNRLLEYILNFQSNIEVVDDKFIEGLSTEQLKVLIDLWDKICTNRHDHIDRNGYGDISYRDLYLYNEDIKNVYNLYRKYTGGYIDRLDYIDSFFEHLQDICINVYPDLIMNQSFNNENKMSAFSNRKFDITKDVELIKQTKIDTLSNGAEGLEYFLKMRFDDESYYTLHASSLFETIVARCFQNAFNRMKYSLSDVLFELKKSYENVLDLVNHKEIKYSVFIGIKGVELYGFDTIDFGDVKLHKWDDSSNPSYHTKKTISIANRDGVKNVIGCILEIECNVKLIDIEEDFNGSYYPSLEEKFNAKLELLQDALIFAKNLTQGFGVTFIESGFPLLLPGNYSIVNPVLNGHILIEEDNVKEIMNWYKLLNKANSTNVKVSLRRLRSAIFDRKDPEDSIIDAVICLESMFSEAFETTLKVTGSVSKYIRVGEERKQLYERLIKLYGLRSKLVHGGSSNLLKNESIYDIKEEIIGVTRECLMKLLEDDEMLKLKSAERYKRLLVLE